MANSDIIINVDDPVQLLPRGLKRKLRHRAAFRRAFEEDKITIEKGEILIKFDTITQFSYFCGRCFSNDFSEKMFKRKVWRKGDHTFPAKELEEFFDVRNLRELRKNNLKSNFFNGFEVVDQLFVIKTTEEQKGTEGNKQPEK